MGIAKGENTPARQEVLDRIKDHGTSVDQKDRAYAAIANLPVARRREARHWFNRNHNRMTNKQTEDFIARLEAGAECR